MRRGGRIGTWAALVACAAAAGPRAWAGTSYNSTTDSSWFNGANWSADPAAAADDDIYLGQGFATLAPEGVVFDPANDPFFQSNQSFTWGATTDTAQNFATINSGQLYLAGGSGSTTSAAGKLTVKSGTLTVKGTTGLIIGRLQSGNTDPNEQAALVVTGGTVTLTAGSIDMSSSNSSATPVSPSQNNTLDYTNGGTINATAKNGSGLRMDPVAIAAGSTFNSTLVLRHVAGGAGSINFASVIFGANSTTAGVANNTAEFHYGGGGVSTVNVGNGSAGNSLKVANITTSGGGTVNSYLSLILDEAPGLTGDGRAPDLALFKLDDSLTGTTANTQGVNTTDATKEFKALDGTPLTEGAVVSASFGGQTYNWNLYYDGNAGGSTITGVGTGNDVVLIGLPAAAVPEPTAVGVIAMGGLMAMRRRRRS